MPSRILVVDDHDVVRKSIRKLLGLRPDWVVCGEASNGLEGIEQAKALRPDVVLMDISMPKMDGVQAGRIIRREVPEAEVIIVSQNDAAIAGRQASEIDARACVSKATLARDLIAAVENTLSHRNGRRTIKAALAIKSGHEDDLPILERMDETLTSDANPKEIVQAATDLGRELSSAGFGEPMQAERFGNLLAAIVDSSDDAIISKSLDGVITSWNKSAERLFGYTPGEAIGQHVFLIIPEDRRDEETQIIGRLKRGDRVDHFETLRRRKDGTLIELSLTISPIRDGAGIIIGASKVARDITEAKRTERALRESEERFRTLSDRLETQVQTRTQELEVRNAEVLQQAEQLRELSTRLLMTQDNERRHIARELHDSAGQLITALGMSLATTNEFGKQNPALEKALANCKDLVQQLNDEIRTTSYLLHPPLLDETGLAHAIEWYMQGVTERSGLQISFDISEGFGRLSADMELTLFRIVQESLTNIHRHSSSQTATISLSRTPRKVSLQISDHGKGIPPEKLAAIKGQRSGVGITGMRERIRHLNGKIDIRSNSSGTTVSVTIPLDPTAPPLGQETILQSTETSR